MDEVREREERIKKEQARFNERFDFIILALEKIELAEGTVQNSWLFAGCKQDLEKARTRILNYIERILR